ncbi:hypothetical protein WJ23_17890 [Burkholderia lata]|nr:hypothetical protein WJ23_17890 [Burkholderia lata]
MRTSNDFIDRYDGARVYPGLDVRRSRDAFVAAWVADAITAHMPGLRQHTLQIGRAAICKPRIDRSPAPPSSIGS